MESCKQVLEALAEYLEGDLTAEDRMRFERHMQDCPPCEAFLKTYCKSGDLAREMLKNREVPAELNDRVRAFLKDRLGLDQ
ncbi:zf-HC2 domain-containing protein [bacterium]|nr:zf-HC2 domain-containing protein [bacterium]|tara:strand:+ start:33 stop:275 length:243 start_codon:yes stop_codon:yes gene_type:complete